MPAQRIRVIEAILSKRRATGACLGLIAVVLTGSLLGCGARPVPIFGDAGPRCAWRPLDIGLRTNVTGIWGTGPDDVYVSAEEDVLMHFDGSRWKRLTLPPELPGDPGKFTTIGPGRGAPLVFNAGVAKREAHGWRVLATQHIGCSLVGGIETSQGQVYVGCRRADIYRIDAGKWKRVYQGGAFFQEFHELPGGRLVVGGAGGSLVRFDGTTWAEMPIDASLSSPGIWAPNDREFYALENGLPHGRVYRYRGDSRELVLDSGLPWGTVGIWGSSATDIHVVGRGVWHYDGGSWRQVRHHPDEGYTNVWGTGPEHIYAGGSTGRFMRYSCRPQ
jgi:hypothetical protein